MMCPNDSNITISLQTGESAGPVVQLRESHGTVNMTTGSSIDHIHENLHHHHINHRDNVIGSSGYQLESTCSVLRKVLHRQDLNASLPFDEQFDSWFASLTRTNHSESILERTRGRLHHKQRGNSGHLHLRRHQNHLKLDQGPDSQEKSSVSPLQYITEESQVNSTEASLNEKNFISVSASYIESRPEYKEFSSHPSKRSDDWSDSLIVPHYIQEMESSIASDNNGSDFVYATCQVEANRAISLLLQQNIQGRINLWQRKDSSGPVYAYVKLAGFRVASNGSRARRETVLMPVETSAQKVPESTDAFVTSGPREHAFHVHTSGDLSRSCQSTGPHLGALSSQDASALRGRGDLGNLKCRGDGTVDAEYTYPHVSLLGPHSIIGKSLVIHSAPDTHTGEARSDELTSSSNDSRVRIACCVVQPVVELPPMDDSPSLIGSLALSDDQSNDHGGR